MRSRSIQPHSCALLWATILLTACGGSAYSAGETTAPRTGQEPTRCEGDAEACERELHARELELSRALGEPDAEPLATGAQGPDCVAARELRDRICDLSAAICLLADRNAGNTELAGKCSSAQDSCSKARADVARGCGP